LTLKEPHSPDPETNEIFPYNEVRVIGPSVVSTPGNGEWSGVAAHGVMLMPIANFGGVIDEPLGKIQALYDVKEIPVIEIPVAPSIRTYDAATSAAGPTPEEVFAAASPGVAPEPGQTRGRTPHGESPLVDPRPKASDGVLGPVPAKRGRPKNVPPTS
jgi:hypothetical protein